MSANRILVSALILTILCAGQDLSKIGPSLGKWAFTGKDTAGVVWTGALVIEKLDQDRFDTNKYHSMCILAVKSASSENGVEAPCRYDPATRAVSFSTGISEITSYAAVLSPDGTSLTEGKWTKAKKGGQAAVSAGTWSAKLAAR
jgi:hypothetical protein